MTKQEAIKQFGQAVVDHARHMYETNYGKILFSEDVQYEDDIPLMQVDEQEAVAYLFRAKVYLGETAEDPC